MERLRSYTQVVFGLVVFVGFLALPFIFIMGAAWASANLLQPLIIIGWLLFALTAVLFLPLSVFKRLRNFTGGAIYLSSYIYGLVTWLIVFNLCYAIWGEWAVVIGILFLGGGVVPIALLATAIKGLWEPFTILIVLSILTFGTRIGGHIIGESGE